MSSTSIDLRHAMRALRRSPGFAAAVIVTLAIGIGANVALFSIVDAVLLRSLPFETPDRVVSIWETGGRKERVSAAAFAEWNSAKSFEDIAAFRPIGFTWRAADQSERVGGAEVSARYFEVLGVRPAAGRLFIARDHEATERIVVLGHEFWRQRFHADPSVVGTTILLDETPYAIVGVAPVGLYPTWPTAAARLSFAERTQQLFLPMGPNLQAAGREIRDLGVVARLRGDATSESAREELTALGRHRGDPKPQHGPNGVVVSALETEITGDVRTALLVLWASVGVVLALCCANVASLLLARDAGRSREIAVRVALGASRGRILGMLLVENLVLAALGGAIGCGLTIAVMPGLVSLLPADLPRLDMIRVDLRAAGFAVLASVVTAFACGAAPALRAGSANPSEGLRGGSAGPFGRTGRRARGRVVVGEVAIAVVLVTAGTLLGRSFSKLAYVDPGFQPTRVLSLHLALPLRYVSSPEIGGAYAELQSRLAAIPGVRSVAISYDLPLESNRHVSFDLGDESVTMPENTAHLAIAGPRYFETLGMRIVAGRPVDARDSPGSSPAAMVSRAFVATHLRNAPAVGQWIRLRLSPSGDGAGTASHFQIVGVVDDVHSTGLARTSEPTIYVSALQFPQRDMSVMLRADIEPASLLPSVRREIARFDPAVALSNPRTLEAVIDAKLAQPRFNTLVIVAFAGTALLLTFVGLHGLLAYSVARRRREIGIRLALGARAGQARNLILREAGALVMTGAAIGIAISLATSHLMGAMLFGVGAHDAVSLVSGVAAVLVCGVAAASVPAWRASLVEPATALRAD